MVETSEDLSKKSQINYWIIGIICTGAIAYFVYGILYPAYNINNFTALDIPWIVDPLGVGIAAFVVAKKYWDFHDVLGKAYLSLSIGFLLYFVGASSYEYCSDFEYTISQQNQNPYLCYPSYPDIFFLSVYPFWYYHILKNIKQWASKIDSRIKIGLIVLACIMMVAFTFFNYSQKPPANVFPVAEAYAVCDAVTLSLAILGALVFRRNKLRNVWLLLVTGFLVLTISDYWYYYDAAIYNEIHPVNALFQVGFVIVIYALYLHKKVV